MTTNAVQIKIVIAAAMMPIVRELKFVMLSLSKLILLCLAAVSYSSAQSQSLPPDIEAALGRARIPKEAVALYVIDAANSGAAPLLSHRANAAMNPASVMKLVTTVAALDLLGSAYTWQTQVFIDPLGKDGSIKEGVLNGNLVIKGGGDPKLVTERLWLLLSRVRSLGINTINGDIVLDGSAFSVPAVNPAAFDGEPMRPYNASPDALLINYKSVVMTFTANAAAGVASIQYDPPLFGVLMPITAAMNGADCTDYRSALRADFSDAKRFRFSGSYPKSCGERVWPIAYADPTSFASLAVHGLWESMGGKLIGTSRAGQASLQAKSVLAFGSPSLGEVIRDMNKFSNNVMAQQLFLTLSLNTASGKPATFEASRAVLLDWWKARYGAFADAPPPTIDNGSGLSRTERITAGALARMLIDAYAAPFMPEIMASLPQSGIDGTLRRSKALQGVAHLKTGSLNNVASRAGYVHAQKAGSEGKRYVMVAIVNSDSPAVMGNARSVFDALVDWTAKQ
jgi:serine-type D-Ala-D-Ala carboxypeptidase/endopeptidase (penicillin-binding protein 4)